MKEIHFHHWPLNYRGQVEAEKSKQSVEKQQVTYQQDDSFKDEFRIYAHVQELKA